MVLAKHLFVIALCLSVSNLGCSATGEASGDVLPSPSACTNCTLCQYPCHTPAPPLPDYPLYGTPPLPPPPPPSLAEYPPYETSSPPPPPPPPPSQLPAQGNCPPTTVVQCCQYPPPIAYGYVPYNNYSASCPSSVSFIPVMVSVFSYAVLVRTV
ncbi:hypothetical protein CJ030_MR4G016275 [Morella rubra]|uniref:4Fe-4S ferredoxin-type domain-containing protein n=1 Tax=Morella rubra TaxID=262757 RepID=A0A6A1VX00_9ROSI|nr:hypothetical protein CJ030_MR4G016275 [Morella rubra]